MSKLYTWNRYFSEDALPFQAMIHRQIRQSIHHHEFLELVIVLNGKGIHYFAGHEYPIAAGDAFVIKEGIDHDYRNPENLIIANVLVDFDRLKVNLQDLEQIKGFYTLFVTEPMLRQQTTFNTRLFLSAKNLKTAEELLHELIDEMQMRPPGYRFVAMNTFFRLLIHVSRCYGDMPHRKVSEVVHLSEMTQYIQHNYKRDISRDEIVRAAHISASTGSRLFRKLLNQTPIGYLTEFRIEKAIEMLQQGEFNITEIALSCGFRDSNYFATVFRKHTGKAPTRF